MCLPLLLSFDNVSRFSRLLISIGLFGWYSERSFRTCCSSTLSHIVLCVKFSRYMIDWLGNGCFACLSVIKISNRLGILIADKRLSIFKRCYGYVRSTKLINTSLRFANDLVMDSNCAYSLFSSHYFRSGSHLLSHAVSSIVSSAA